MTIWKRFFWFLLGGITVPAIAIFVINAFLGGEDRPPAPPEHSEVPLPWGAVDLDETDADSNLEDSLIESFAVEPGTEFDEDGDGVREYPVLALSGGGSNGAFGAGLLCGWTARGDRPEFKVVTGVSTGSLQSTFAFLGSEFDKQLKEIFTAYDTPQIYRRRQPLAGVLDDAIYDMSPLRGVIEHHVTEEVLAAVAVRHATGHRLYVGTTNMDTTQFVIWDMGKIASEGRRELFIDVLLASSSVPVLFPPVYFPVEIDGRTYYEMHMDGGTHSNVFFRGFLLDFEDALEQYQDILDRSRITMYLIRNGKPGNERQTVGPRAFSIAAATINSVFKMSNRSSLFRIYVLAQRYGVDLNLASIPVDTPLETDVLEFDREAMGRLFKVGYDLAKNGYPWRKAPEGLDPDEIIARTVEDVESSN